MFTGIALGSNVGDRLRHLRRARDEIAARFGAARCSRVYETEPDGCEPDTAAFLNAVIEIDFDGSPHALLHELRAIEERMGRPAMRSRNAPRTIDLDLLYAGETVLAGADLTLPHPRLHLRRFVLAPLGDLRPDLVIPGQTKTVAQLIENLPPHPQAAIYPEPL